MKKTVLLVVMLLVIFMAGCSNSLPVNESLVEKETVSFSAGKNENSTNSEKTTEFSTSQEKTSVADKSATTETKTEKPTEKKTEPQTTTKNAQNSTTKPTTTKPNATQKSTTTTQKVTTTQKPTTTQKATTQKVTTTTKPTMKKQGLSKSDIEWVQTQANSYIKSKGCSVNSEVESFSGRISSKPFSNRNELLAKVKESVDVEYQECISSGWNSVDMYCKIESRSDGSYFIYVMYG